MARIDLARRAEIGREKRARTRAQIVEAGAMLLAERPPRRSPWMPSWRPPASRRGRSTITS